MDDRSTLNALAGGDADAWRRLVEQESARVFRTCYRILGRVDVAEDVAQETFIAAYRSIGSYRGDGSMGAWLCRIATRESWRRAGKERRRASVLSPLDDAREHELHDARDPLAAAISAEQAEQIRRAVAELPELYREVISLRFFSELSIEDVAAVMRRPTGTVKAQLHRGQSRLRQQMGRTVLA